VWRHCAENGWWSVFGKKKSGKKAKVGAPAHDDLVKRVFTADRPNQLWLTDIERHEALLNLAVMKGHRHSFVAADGLKLRAA
jgi:hypothetical protein